MKDRSPVLFESVTNVSISVTPEGFQMYPGLVHQVWAGLGRCAILIGAQHFDPSKLKQGEQK